jgi:hypothetical protein
MCHVVENDCRYWRRFGGNVSRNGYSFLQHQPLWRVHLHLLPIVQHHMVCCTCQGRSTSHRGLQANNADVRVWLRVDGVLKHLAVVSEAHVAYTICRGGDSCMFWYNRSWAHFLSRDRQYHRGCELF